MLIFTMSKHHVNIFYNEINMIDYVYLAGWACRPSVHSFSFSSKILSNTFQSRFSHLCQMNQACGYVNLISNYIFNSPLIFKWEKSN